MGKRGMNPVQAAELKAAAGLKITKLQKLRIKRGLSQSELAEISGVPALTIRGFEQEKRQLENAKMSILLNLCIALKCRFEDIIENKEILDKLQMIK